MTKYYIIGALIIFGFIATVYSMHDILNEIKKQNVIMIKNQEELLNMTNEQINIQREQLNVQIAIINELNNPRQKQP